MDETVTTPCRACGTTGGWIRPTNPRPSRLFGLCAECYGAALQRGDFDGQPHLPDPRASRAGRLVNAQLTEQDVRDIRDEHAVGQTTYAMLGVRYGVHPETISKVVRRRTWTHVV